MAEYEKLTGFDREIWYDELEEFVPQKIFDAHTHLWNNRYCPADTIWSNTDFARLDEFSRMIFPGREISYQLLGTPVAGLDIDGYHRFMAEEIAKSPCHIGSTIVTPEMTPEYLDVKYLKSARFSLSAIPSKRDICIVMQSLLASATSIKLSGR